MNEIRQTLNPDAWPLELYSDTPVKVAAEARSELPAAATGVQAFGAGTFGSKVTQTLVRQVLEHDGAGLAAAYFDYPIPAMPDLPVRLAPGRVEPLPAQPFCAVGEVADRRDRARQYPLLRERYSQSRLFRGIAVYEDRKLGISGEGGGAIPSVTSLDIDLNVVRILAYLRDNLRWLLGISAGDQDDTDLKILMRGRIYQEQLANQRWIIPVIGGGTGATGNALLQILPYLIRYVLREMGVRNYQLWGMVLGPHAFRGLTPYVLPNYQALLYSLDSMAHRGLRRKFINGLDLDVDEPPYDHLFLIDDGTLPTDSTGRATEPALDEFAGRAARAIRVLLRSNAWDMVAARLINPDGAARDDGKLRWMTTVSVATAAVDRSALVDLTAARLQTRLLQTLAERMAPRAEPQAAHPD